MEKNINFNSFYESNILPEIKKNPNFKMSELYNMENYYIINLDMEKLLYKVNKGDITDTNLIAMSYIYDPSRFNGPKPANETLKYIGKLIFKDERFDIKNNFSYLEPFLFQKFPGLYDFETDGFYTEIDLSNKYLKFNSFEEATKDEYCIIKFNMSLGCKIGNKIIRYNLWNKERMNNNINYIITEDILNNSKNINISDIQSPLWDYIIMGENNKKFIVVIYYEMDDNINYSILKINGENVISKSSGKDYINMFIESLRKTTKDTMLVKYFDRYYTHMKFITYLNRNNYPYIKKMKENEIEKINNEIIDFYISIFDSIEKLFKEFDYKNENNLLIETFIKNNLKLKYEKFIDSYIVIINNFIYKMRFIEATIISRSFISAFILKNNTSLINKEKNKIFVSLIPDEKEREELINSVKKILSSNGIFLQEFIYIKNDKNYVYDYIYEIMPEKLKKVDVIFYEQFKENQYYIDLTELFMNFRKFLYSITLHD